MQKTMAEVRRVAEAIGWSPETLARAWEAAGIAIAADPVTPWQAAYVEWARDRKHDVIPEEEVWRDAVNWCLAEVCGYETLSLIRFQEFCGLIWGEHLTGTDG